MKMDLKEKARSRVEWINLAHNKVQWQVLVKYGNELSGLLKGREFIHCMSKGLCSEQGCVSRTMWPVNM
jgi:hypothetical protein